MKAFMRDLLICIGLALVFAFLGVYDSDNMTLPIRVIFWTVLMCLGGVLLFIIEPLTFGKFLKNHHPIIQIAAISAIISIPIMIFLVGLNTQFKFNWPLENWVLQYLSVIIISLIVVFGRYFISQIFAQRLKIETSDSAPQLASKRFLERLPVKFRSANLYAISSEGHYLRAYTDKGSTLILMRISDAVKELKGADGLQVHRSWWIARDGIEDIKKTKGRKILVLKTGESVPVSRAYLAALKAANLTK